MADKIYDVIVVGAGNAALSAALAARENCESLSRMHEVSSAISIHQFQIEGALALVE